MAVRDRWQRSPASRCTASSPTVTETAKPTKVFVYAAGGYDYPGKEVAALQDEMRGYLDSATRSSS